MRVQGRAQSFAESSGSRRFQGFGLGFAVTANMVDTFESSFPLFGLRRSLALNPGAGFWRDFGSLGLAAEMAPDFVLLIVEADFTSSSGSSSSRSSRTREEEEEEQQQRQPWGRRQQQQQQQ